MNKIKIYFVVTLLFFSFITLFFNYKYYQSINLQRELLVDWNMQEMTIPINRLEKQDFLYPSLSITAMPMKFLIGRYFLYKEETQQKGISMIKSSIKDNPYLGVQELELANFYNQMANLDSTYYYTRIAYDKLPSNLHAFNLISTLSELKNESELDQVFNELKDKNEQTIWSNYIYAKIKINPNKSKDSILELLNSGKSVFKKNEASYEYLKSYIQVGNTNLTEYVDILESAEKYFQNKQYDKSAEMYLKASIMDPNERTNLENLGLCYFNLNKFDKAINYFESYLKQYRRSPKILLYLGVSKIENGDQSGCDLINESIQMGFSGAKEISNVYCK